jgi:hypothetical protein
MQNAVLATTSQEMNKTKKNYSSIGWNPNLKTFTAPLAPETIGCIFTNKPMILAQIHV